LISGFAVPKTRLISPRQASITGENGTPNAGGDLPPTFAVSAQPERLVAPEYPRGLPSAYRGSVPHVRRHDTLPDQFALELRERRSATAGGLFGLVSIDVLNDELPRHSAVHWEQTLAYFRL
jgi:hypothetical protein